MLPGARSAILLTTIEEYEQGSNPANQTIGQYARRFHELREGDPSISPLSYKREELDVRHVCALFANELGHSQISMTMDTYAYAHALDVDEMAAAEAMDRILGDK